MDLFALQEILLQELQELQETQDVNTDSVESAGSDVSADAAGTAAPAVSQDEIMDIQISTSQQQFVMMEVFDTLRNLKNKLEVVKSVTLGNKFINSNDENIQTKLSQYLNIIEVLSKVGVNMDVLSLYKITGQIELEIIQLLKTIKI